VIQTKIQTAEYWESGFSLSDSDLEQIYNFLLENEIPQSATDLARVVIDYRIKQQTTELSRLMTDNTVYQPQKSYQIGEEVVFPALKMARGTVKSLRQGYNPEAGSFNVITVDIKGKSREFAADYELTHSLNSSNGGAVAEDLAGEQETIQTTFGPAVAAHIDKSLAQRDDFVKVIDHWFIKSLMVDVNIGHLHLAEAVLEVSEGGPLTTAEILPHLELDPDANPAIREFSLAYHMEEDGRFEQVSPTHTRTWYLVRMEPEGVRTIPERLEYTPVSYNRSLLTPQQIQLEQELDDEWSNLPPAVVTQPITLALSYPHRWAGTLPLNSKISTLFNLRRSPRQRIVLIDDETNVSFPGWVVAEGRYIYGLSDWYKENAIPVGGFLHFQTGPEPGTFLVGFDRRRAQREWVRLATVKDNRINFELLRRSIPCGYDDLLIVGTDVVTAIDAHARRATSNHMSIVAILAEIFPSLANLSPQNSVHAKTLYSAVNMLRRLPPGPIFAELVKQPAFTSVGDHYWQYDAALGRD
jgi:hypothetical protein